MGKKRERRVEERKQRVHFKTKQNFAFCTSPNFRSRKSARLNRRPQSAQFIKGV